MAKGRKTATPDRHDRLLGTHGHDRNAQRSVGPDLAEEDVWPVPLNRDETEPDRTDRNDNRRQLGGLSLVFDDPNRNAPGRHVAGSMPVDVPDWSRMAHVEPDDSVDDTEWVPPHEYLAREQGRRSVTTSMFEGVGRTLKGRDMSRVRNAVWSQTGFFG